ncbi:hypothetical protein [Chryseobacterium koreense]|uniref:Uncharacterized protein n=1 Tax=Chryseobacterium koreense CCUG 49689 TaxID=1304281 RepID=A0A0J7J2Q2_9FLAO|nr:hypothetical protein [Chryseobacterium koreense]KMQ72668.1 hypothetical protein ACM44_00825 [Chryseobacterium koreense CCUG 49689]MBB5333069.1 hypothetical protein [Chryseobacterium koreense]
MIKKIYIALLIIFGLMTVIIGGSVIFDLFGMRAKEGNFVPIVVHINFICGFLYLLSAYAINTKKSWTLKPLAMALVLLILAWIGLWHHIEENGLYEQKTIYAMAFRTILTLTLILTFTKIFKK